MKNQQIQILKLMVLNQPGLIIVERGVKLHKPKPDSIPDCSLDFCFLSIVSTLNFEPQGHETRPTHARGKHPITI